MHWCCRKGTARRANVMDLARNRTERGRSFAIRAPVHVTVNRTSLDVIAINVLMAFTIYKVVRAVSRAIVTRSVRSIRRAMFTRDNVTVGLELWGKHSHDKHERHEMKCVIFSRLTCDQCEVRKYGFSTDGCKECECDSIGSRDLQCDTTGQCPCLDNVEGRRCDRCKENKYDRRRGCIDCPDCYNLVQQEARDHSSKLNRLNEILDEIERSPTVITDDDEFPDELKHLQSDIDDFYKKVKNATGEDSVIQQVYNIRKREKDIRRVLSEMDENMFVINNTAQLTAQKLQDTDMKLEEIKANLDETFGAIEANGKDVLQAAWTRAETVGQQSDKMTEIAKEARELADRLTERADDLKKQGEEAKNKSNIAFNQVKNATIMQNEIADETRRMRGELVNAEARLNNTLNTTKQAREDAKAAKDEALSLLNEVNNLVVPYVDTDQLRKESKTIKEDANDLLEKSEMLFRNNEEQLNSVEERLDFGRDLLGRAQEQQDETADLLNELHIYKSQADKAVNLGDTLLNETKSIYNLLTGTMSKVQQV